MNDALRVLRVVSAAVLAGITADDLGAPVRVACAVVALTGLLFITILEAGSWRDS